MDIDFSLFDNDRLLGESAMRPIAPRLTRQAALGWARQRPCDTLRLVGISLLRCHVLPGTPIAAHSGAFNCGF